MTNESRAVIKVTQRHALAIKVNGFIGAERIASDPDNLGVLLDNRRTLQEFRAKAKTAIIRTKHKRLTTKLIRDTLKLYGAKEYYFNESLNMHNIDSDSFSFLYI